jgi:hypothetical protein
MKKLLEKKWLQALIVFLPFTGMINPLWYAILFFIYFVVGGWYFMIYEPKE